VEHVAPTALGGARAAPTQRRRLKLVHTSDVHIDGGASSPFSRQEPGFTGRAETAFRQVIDAARDEGADLLLIAGDLFESSRVGGAAIDFVLGELSRATCTVVLLPGNHDCYDDASVYRRVDFEEAGSHVHTLTSLEGETLALPGLHATVWGRAMADHDHSNRPLAGIPARSGDWWHLGIAHGLLTADRSEQRSSLITPEEIEGSGLDYLALGHVHVFREVSQRSTTACYSGSPAPLHRAAGEAGSVAVVTLDPAFGVTLTCRSIEPPTRARWR
jgi:exonuclease SbcD